MSVIRISQPITGYSIKKPRKNETSESTETSAAPKREELHEGIRRPEVLTGNTYKIKTPVSEHAMYVTINDVVINEGTEHEHRRPSEIFINSKNMEHHQWIVALTRIISAVFRKGGEIAFLVDELKAVFDPRGGYFKPGGKWMNSIVAEIGDVIERHLKSIGMIEDKGFDEHQKNYVEAKRQEAMARAGNVGEYPANATLCSKCNEKAVIVLDGCQTCISCGSSKCQ